jgi:NTP pyrophosphatase (non-canonical NTP hydrolase)
MVATMTLFRSIRGWAHERNLIDGSNPQAQFVKLIEEAGELAAGIARKQHPAIEDGIGDMIVVLTILAEQHGLDIEQCIEVAWHSIKDRTGRMVDGVFIKDSEIK